MRTRDKRSSNGRVAFRIEGRRISRQFASWEKTPAQSFCLLLSLAKWHRDWASAFGSDHNEQGSLFEDLTKESLEKLFGDWTIHQTGWTRTRVNKLRSVVEDVASHLARIIHEGARGGQVRRIRVAVLSETAKRNKIEQLLRLNFGDGAVLSSTAGD